MRGPLSLSLVLAAAIAVPLLGAGAISAQTRLADIGLASATKNEVIVVGEANKGLKIGDTIFQDQHIRTGRDSAAQLLFKDETALTMGPNSSLILDKAVYDPEKKAGEISVRAVSGAFRFISGSSPVGSYSINTPAGTVGIRGTWIEMLVDGDTLRIIVRRGLVRFCNTAGACANIFPGYEMRALKDRLGTPQKVSHETVESIVALWFNENTKADLANLAPGAGPNGNETGPNSGNKPFWWLDGAYRGPDFQPKFGTFPTGFTPPDTTPPPSGPNPNFLQRKAFLFLIRTSIQIARYIDHKTHSYWQLKKVQYRIKDEVRDLARYARETIPTIETREDLRAFKREVRKQAREIRREVREAVRSDHHHHHRHRHRHRGHRD